MSKKISINYVMKLYNLFSSKKWNEIENNDHTFESLCTLTDNLSEDQADLIIELTERYKWITYNDYNSRLTKILKELINDFDGTLNKIYIFPIIKPEDEEKIKSGSNIIYMIRGIKPFLPSYQKIKFIELNKFHMLSEENLKLKENEILLLVDDYVGSGETLTSTLTEAFKNSSVNNKNLIVSSLIMQNDSTEILDNKKIKYYFSEKVIKEISQYYQSPEKEIKVNIMKEIENLIPGNHFSFGYEGSEALVTMIRTPDNTFPIFWQEYRKNGIKFKPPFPRE